MSNEKIKPGPTPFEKELSVEVRITALNGANVRGIKVFPEDMADSGGEAFIFEEIKKAIVGGFAMDKRLRRDHVKRLGIDKDLGGE